MVDADSRWTVDPLGSWEELCMYMSGAREEDCIRLMRLEKEGRARKSYIKRIHSRLNRMRRIRERQELAGEK